MKTTDADLPKKPTSVYLDVKDNVYHFSDGVNMPFKAYDDYVKSELDGEYPTEPLETSEAIFRARAEWEASG